MFMKTFLLSTGRWRVPLLAVTRLSLDVGLARAQSTLQQLVNESATTFSHFMRAPDMARFSRHCRRAKAVLIAPTIVKAGYISGGSGGLAIVFARDSTSGRWVGPAFFGLGATSVGFQPGVDVSQSVMLAMTERALDHPPTL